MLLETMTIFLRSPAANTWPLSRMLETRTLVITRNHAFRVMSFPPRHYNCGQTSKLLVCYIVEPRGITKISRYLNTPFCLLLLTPCNKFTRLRYATAVASIVLHKRT